MCLAMLLSWFYNDSTDRISNMLNTLINWFKPTFHIDDCIAVAASLRGIRQENQDNYLLIHPTGKAHYLHNEQGIDSPYQHRTKIGYRLAVTDGMGGHEGGRQVSQALVQQLRHLALQTSAKTLRQNIYQIHYELWCAFSQKNSPKSAGTTLVMADVQENGKTVIANIGDSRAYLWRNQHWRCLSHDQTLNEYDWRDGDINDQDYQTQALQKSSALSQAMAYGSFGLIQQENNFKPRQLSQHLRLDLSEDLSRGKRNHADVFHLQLQAGDALLLASDGLWSGYLSEEEFLPPSPQQLETPEKMRQYFQKKVIEKGGTDNITAVMLWNIKT